MSVLALLITLCDHGAGLGERALSGDLKAGVRISVRAFDEAARGPDVEVGQSRMGVALGREAWLVGKVLGAGCAAFIVPPSDVVTLARPFGGLAHPRIRQRRAGFLMTAGP
jgi:hypothetical protein